VRLDQAGILGIVKYHIDPASYAMGGVHNTRFGDQTYDVDQFLTLDLVDRLGTNMRV
jgi:hypothetical protein